MNVFFVFLGWLILVPRFGFIFGIVGGFGSFLVFFYSKFEQQPIMVLVIFAAAVIAFFVWGFFASAPVRSIRASVVAFGFVLVVLVTVPILNQFAPDDNSLLEPQEQSTPSGNNKPSGNN